MSDTGKLSPDQMRSWLLLEGWVPYHRPDEPCMFLFSQDGKAGYFLGATTGSMVHDWVGEEETARDIHDVPDEEIQSMYDMQTGAVPYEP